LATDSAEIGVFGGSGFYSLIDNPREIWVETPYGAPSDKIALGEIAGRKVAFLPGTVRIIAFRRRRSIIAPTLGRSRNWASRASSDRRLAARCKRT
jgi:5'-methylthioadenosine phosphorylase